MEEFQELLLIKVAHMLNEAKSVAFENELEGSKQNSRLLWKVLKKLSSSGKVKSMPNGFSGSRKSTYQAFRLHSVIYCRQ